MLVIGCSIGRLGSGQDESADFLALGHRLLSLERMRNFQGRFLRGILEKEDFLLENIQLMFA